MQASSSGGRCEGRLWQDIAGVAFDLDDTLAPSKSPVPEVTADLLGQLSQRLPVCVISGGNYDQFRGQLLSRLPRSGQGMTGLHLMPTCGTQYYRWVSEDDEWGLVYSHELQLIQRQRAAGALEEAARSLGLWEPDDRVTGPRIEDRGTQVTFSALGQRAAIEHKKIWDPDGSKRRRLAQRLSEMLPDLEVRAGGSTSVDITRQGVDKAFGIERYAQAIGVKPCHVLFVGDRLDPGGNDYPVLRLGVRAHPVRHHEETVSVMQELLKVLHSAKGAPN